MASPACIEADQTAGPARRADWTNCPDWPARPAGQTSWPDWPGPPAWLAGLARAANWAGQAGWPGQTGQPEIGQGQVYQAAGRFSRRAGLVGQVGMCILRKNWGSASPAQQIFLDENR